MANRFSLALEPRDAAGRGASRRLRRSGKVPGIVYGGGQEPTPVLLDEHEIRKNAAEEAFFSSILTLKFKGEEQQGILKDVQVHPARRQVLHVDLQRVLANEKIRISVPLHLLNEANAKGVKEGGGIVNHLLTEVTVSCLPKDLPEYLELDIVDLELNKILHLSDIRLPTGVEIPELAAGPDNDRPVVSIHLVKEIVEEPLPGELPPVEGEVAAVEGAEGAAAAPAEGAAAGKAPAAAKGAAPAAKGAAPTAPAKGAPAKDSGKEKGGKDKK
jgi:large subunit ribosomal protein L25